jgi:excisionase family DNA binding protein
MLLTIKDLSAWLNIKPSTLYLWAAQGKIPCHKIHGLIRFEREAISEWLRSFEPKQQPLPALKQGANKELELLVEAAKRDAYTARGETKPSSSLIRKEEVDGAV